MQHRKGGGHNKKRAREEVATVPVIYIHGCSIYATLKFKKVDILGVDILRADNLGS